MAVRVRLTRVGSRKNPVWRVVVADQRSPRDGRIIEQIGHYDPRPQPSRIVIDHERLEHWLQRGAEPTNTVRKLMRAPSTPVAVAAAETEPSETEGAAIAVAEPEGGAEIDASTKEAEASEEATAESSAEASTAGPDAGSDAESAAAEPTDAAPQADAPKESS